MRNFIISLVSVLLLALVFGFSSIWGSIRPTGEPEARAHSDHQTAPPPPSQGQPGHAGLNPRPAAAPANEMRDEWALHPNELGRLRDVADSGINLNTEWMEQGETWLYTKLDLDDPFLAAAERRKCAAVFAEDLKETCRYDLVMVLAPTATGEAEIAYSRADLLPDSSDECRQIVGCIARSRLGQRVHAPAGTNDLRGLRQSMSSGPVPSVMKNPAKLRAILESMEEDLRRAKELGLDQGDVELRLRMLFAERQSEYARSRLAELEAENQ